MHTSRLAICQRAHSWHTAALSHELALQVVQAGAAAAVVAPLLRPSSAEANTFVKSGAINSEAAGGGKAPVRFREQKFLACVRQLAILSNLVRSDHHHL